MKKVIFSLMMIVVGSGCNYSYQCVAPTSVSNGIVICKDVKILKDYE